MKPTESLQEPSPTPGPPECLGRDEQCPLCGGDNRCRVAKGHLYKGRCWCHEIIVPHHILSRLAANRLEPACLCRPCLEAVARISNELDGTEAILAEIQRARSSRGPCSEEKDFYLDDNGNMVFTAACHLRRGTCCRNDCRHCPYGAE